MLVLLYSNGQRRFERGMVLQLAQAGNQPLDVRLAKGPNKPLRLCEVRAFFGADGESCGLFFRRGWGIMSCVRRWIGGVAVLRFLQRVDDGTGCEQPVALGWQRDEQGAL